MTRQTWRDASGASWAVCEEHASTCRLEMPGVGVFILDRETEEAIAYPAFALQGEAFVVATEKAALPLLHQALGAVCLHASAASCWLASSTFGAVGFVGASRSGKSTLATAWCRRFDGAAPLADDVLVLVARDGVHRVRGIPFVQSLRPGTAAHFGIDVSTLERVAPAAEEPALAALFVLRPDDAAAAPLFEPLGPADALLELVRQAHCFRLEGPSAGGRFFGPLLDLIERTPVWRLRFPHDFARLDALLDAFDAHVRARWRGL